MCSVPSTAAEKHGVKWQKLASEILEIYSARIRIDRSNPPGNETKAADYLKNVLEREGFQTKSFALEPTRANLVARLKNNGSKRPLLMIGHTAVVGVQPGRGTNDDIDIFTACLMVMLLLKLQRAFVSTASAALGAGNSIVLRNDPSGTAALRTTMP